jgi:hypothetical protein
MPAFKIGFGSDFTLANQLVGIGTTTARRKLEVDGVLKGDFNVSGVSTLTVYGGFASQKQNVSVASTTGFSTSGVGTFVQVTESETGYLSLVGEYNTVSEDIIVDEGRIFEVSVGSTVSPGTLESVSIQSHFSVPNGGISSRPNQPTEGMVRFNDDLNTLEFYNGIEWRQFTVSGASGRGVFGGGVGDGASNVSVIDSIQISTQGNAVNFGNASTIFQRCSAVSSSIRGAFNIGQTPAIVNNIEYITIASESNSIDFGDLTITRLGSASFSSSTRGIFAGGFNPAPGGSDSNVIDYIQISTLGNALDFGDASIGRHVASGCSSSTRGVFAGGNVSPTVTASIEFLTISSTGNSVNFGNLNSISRDKGSCSNSIRGLFAGGRVPAFINSIDYITFSSVGNAQDFGDLTAQKWGTFGASNSIRGVFAGGYVTPSHNNSIDFISINSFGNAQDFGDLTVARYSGFGLSDSHGGLGGF